MKGKERLDRERRRCAKEVEALGLLRSELHSSQIARAIYLLRKIHNVESSRGIVLPGLPALPAAELLETIRMPNSASSSSSSAAIVGSGSGVLLATGVYGVAAVATGTARTATLAWLGGSSVAAGSILLGGLLVAPAVLVVGLVESKIARENLANTIRHWAEVEEQVRLRTAASVVDGLRRVAAQYRAVTEKLSGRTARVLDELQGVIDRRETRLFSVQVSYDELDHEDRRKGLRCVCVYTRTQGVTSSAYHDEKRGSAKALPKSS